MNPPLTIDYRLFNIYKEVRRFGNLQHQRMDSVVGPKMGRSARAPFMTSE